MTADMHGLTLKLRPGFSAAPRTSPTRAVARQNLLGGPSSVAEQGHIHIQDVEQFSF